MWSVLFAFMLLFASRPALAEVACECEAATCGPCEIETGTSYFTEKCGEGGARMKSCRKPSCAPVENQTACFALFKKGASAPTVSSREPASVVRVAAGEVSAIEGTASLRRGTKAFAAAAGTKLFVGDRLETASGAKLRALLLDGSEITLASATTVEIAQLRVDVAAGRREIKIDLVSGRVRSRVTKKFSALNIFEVRTKTATALVIGTDFVMTFERGHKEWLSDVHTLEGKVRLQSPGAEEGVDIPAGNFATMIIAVPEGKDVEEEFLKSIEQRFFSAPAAFKEEDEAVLRKATEITAAPASAKRALSVPKPVAPLSPDSVCQAPAGDFNQCSFTCEGAHGKHCVSCVRRLCRANGTWADPQKMPASQMDLCGGGQAPVVRECGSYF